MGTVLSHVSGFLEQKMYDFSDVQLKFCTPAWAEVGMAWE